MRPHKKPETVRLQVDGLTLSVPQELYQKIELLACYTKKSVPDYVRLLLSNESTRFPGWENYPAEIEALLRLYRFCLDDCTKTHSAKNNLHA